MRGKALPQSAYDRVRTLVGCHPYETVVAITGYSKSTIWKMKRRGWQAQGNGYRNRPRPTDFAIQSKHLSTQALAAHYKTSTRSVTRWKRELLG